MFSDVVGHKGPPEGRFMISPCWDKSKTLVCSSPYKSYHTVSDIETNSVISLQQLTESRPFDYG